MMSTVTRVFSVALAGVFSMGCAAPEAAVEYGLASYHAPFFLSGEAKTASGERWWGLRKIAAHKSLPFGTTVRVTNLENGKDVKARIIDRGPYVAGRIIDVSRRAAGRLGMVGAGVVRVKLEVLDTP